MIIAFSSHSLLLTQNAANSRSAVEVNVENERFIVVSSRCRSDCKFHVIILHTAASKNRTKVRAARAA